jgi:hypothetical protein
MGEQLVAASSRRPVSPGGSRLSRYARQAWLALVVGLLWIVFAVGLNYYRVLQDGSESACHEHRSEGRTSFRTAEWTWSVPPRWRCVYADPEFDHSVPWD